MIFFILLGLLGQGLALKCYEGLVRNSTLSIGDFTKKDCPEDFTLCFSLHSNNSAKPLEMKTCWNPEWEHGLYSKDGCIIGQHCIEGTCYENATACMCDYDDYCNDWLNDGQNDTHFSTAMPLPPTPAKDGHMCYYGLKENKTESSLENQQQCREGESLCVRVSDEADDYEYRSCWDDDFSIEYSRPGCYVGFTHCHHGRCHNDTTVCVCADNLCNDEKFSSEAPPVTPGSGLYCYHQDYHHHHHPPGQSEEPEERWQWDWEECDKGENFCIEITHDVNSNNTEYVHFRGCWSPEYEGGRYNFTGCEVGQHCMFGDCLDNTVCLCQENLCNNFGLDSNFTTEVPTNMTTTNNTLSCFYGFQLNSSEPETDWQTQTCSPDETACMVQHGDNGFMIAGCYDFSYNDGKYTAPGCYEEGEHCWDNRCHNGTLCLCDDGKLCNDPHGTTPTPHPTTPGSGLECLYGFVGTHESHNNLTTQICNINQTLCLTVYGEDDSEGVMWFSCHDPHQQGAQFSQGDVCIENSTYCWPQDHPDSVPDCMSSTVCTCNTTNCNTYNASSTFSSASPASTQPDTQVCYFGEKHPTTGEETWKHETCQPNEDHCFQMVSKSGFEVRQCWDLKYEDEEFAGAGCYKGHFCHHQHCFHDEDVTVCICEGKLCNDWTDDGNVTTPNPVTDGSGILCYQGEAPQIESTPCRAHQTMCSYLLTTDGKEILDCFDPTSNDGEYYATGCYDNASVEDQMGNKHAGKFCVCDGDRDDLCNEDYMKKDPDSGAASLAGTLSLVISIFFFCTL